VAETRRVLDFAAGAGVRNFLLISSGAVYGRQPPELTHIPEDYSGAPDPLLPGSAWGEGKRVIEHVCARHANRHCYALKVARGFAFVGPHLPLDANYAIGNFIQDALAGAPIHVSGDGTPRRSYLYAADLAVWLWTLLFAAPSARAYNVGAAVDMSIAELAGLVSQVAGVSGAHPPVEIAGQSDPGRPVSRYVPAVNRAQTELGLRPRIPLEEAIRKTIAWHRTNPAPDFGSPGSASQTTL
jgi:dTDP-glucose 4,6-dehydratase